MTKKYNMKMYEEKNPIKRNMKAFLLGRELYSKKSENRKNRKEKKTKIAVMILNVC